jgi:hypothetical protein
MSHDYHIVDFDVCRPPDIPGHYYIVASMPSGSISTIVGSSHLPSNVHLAAVPNTANAEATALHAAVAVANKELTGAANVNEVSCLNATRLHCCI